MNGKTEPKILNCAIYTRKSTDENLNTDFNTLDSQREYCESFIKARGGEGWRICPEQYNDGGFSGGNMNRPALKRLLADATKGKIQIVVCYKFDRLSRNTMDFLRILEIFDQYGASFVSVTQPIDTTSSVGRLMRSILMDFSQFEREVIAERTRDKLDAMARKGKRTGGHPVLGYGINSETKQFEIIPAEAEQVKDIFEVYTKRKSLYETVKIINDKGYRTKEWLSAHSEGKRKLGGRKFNKQTLWNLLRNPVFIGKITHRREFLPGIHQPILSEEIFNEVQRILNANGNGLLKRSYTTDTYPYLLRGLVKCASCNSAMTPHTVVPKNKPRFHYYKCVSTMKMNRNACFVRSVPAGTLEEYVILRLATISSHPETLERIIQNAKTETQTQLPKKREERKRVLIDIGKTDNQIKNLVGVLADEGPASSLRAHVSQQIGEFEEKRKNLQESMVLVEREIEELELKQVDVEVIKNSLGNFVSLIEMVPLAQKRELLQLLIDKIVYDHPNREIHIGLRPLPEAWGNPDLLKVTLNGGPGRQNGEMDSKGNDFVYRKASLGDIDARQNALDSDFVYRKVPLPECNSTQNPGLENSGDRFDYCLSRLPECNSNQNRKQMIINKAELDDGYRNGIGVPESLDFGRVNRRKGLIEIVLPDEATEIRKRQRRWEEPKPPPLKKLLEMAYRLHERLRTSPRLTRDAVAKENGINPSYLTRILNLLNLAPEIQKYILSLPPSCKKGPFVESRVKHLARMRNHQHQLKEFEKLKGATARRLLESA